MNGGQRLAQAIQRLRNHRPAPAECQKPDAPADLPMMHGLRLAAIEDRLAKLEQQMSQQTRLLIIGIIAILGDLLRQILHP